MRGVPFYGRVLPGGLLVMESPKAYAAHVRSFAGKFIEVYFQQRKQKRSHQANRFYWGYVLNEIADAAGYSKDEAHEALKHQFLKADGDGPLVRIKSTADLSTEDFSAYVERCMALGAEMFGIVWEPMSTQEGAR